MPPKKDVKAKESLGSPASLINMLVKNKAQRELILYQITTHGPPHKQLQHTLVLNRLAKLTTLLKKKGHSFELLSGHDLEEEETGEMLQLQLPQSALKKDASLRKILSKFDKGPTHEILYTALLLQVIENLIRIESEK